MRRVSRTILLVDDFPDALEMYEEYLTFKGYQVVTAADGPSAIKAAQEHQPDLVLMDLQMPVIDGTTALQILRADARFNHVPIAALTAHAMEDERVAALLAGFDAVIPKPCLPDELVVAVEQLLATPREVS